MPTGPRRPATALRGFETARRQQAHHAIGKLPLHHTAGDPALASPSPSPSPSPAITIATHTPTTDNRPTPARDLLRSPLIQPAIRQRHQRILGQRQQIGPRPRPAHPFTASATNAASSPGVIAPTYAPRSASRCPISRS
ncbi:hypothetical protein GCM10009839_79360 [Catenulispora yoronensis]|uniref:Uncharacterized protein n=1 Tax=Catenulispora yoronensis TaxID=450799 RepID=A0ABN2VB30_9ACTN